MRRLALLLLVTLVLTTPLTGVAGAQSGPNEVLLVRVDDVVTRGTSLQIENALEEAEDRGVPLVIQLDTPGGLVDATLDIYRSIVGARVPVLTFVGPQGGFAASAGTLILLMGDPAGMAPNTQIGSAQPIQQSPGGGTTNASEKVENFLVQRIQDIAERTGRNQTLAAQFITDNLNMDPDRALETGMVDVVAPDLRAFLDEVDGAEAITGRGNVTLQTENARVIEHEKGLMVQLVELIGNPQIALVLFMIGVYGIIFGLANPGTYIPETVGAIVLVLALIGMGLFDTSTSGFLLLLLAAGLFVAEVFTPTHGFLTAAGVIALVLGAVFLVDEPLLPGSFFRDFLLTAIVTALASGGGVLVAVTIALKAQRRPVADIVGTRGTVNVELDPQGKVRVRGETWTAVSATGEPIPEGAEVVVVDREGLTLTVRPSQREASLPQGSEEPPEAREHFEEPGLTEEEVRREQEEDLPGPGPGTHEEGR